MLYSELFAAHLKQLKSGEMSTAVEALIEKAFAISRTEFWIKKNQPVRDAAALRKFRGYFTRLLADEPLAYILREKDFFGATFIVSPAVLIPRPETELLVEKALEIVADKPARILDIGTGSGVIAITIALRSPATLTAVDTSRPALRVLKKNIARFGLRPRIKVCAADLFPKRSRLYDMIIANPPYLSCRDWEKSPLSITQYEPQAALVAGPKGTETLARIIAGAGERLAPRGLLLLEIGHGQLLAVRALLKSEKLREIEYRRDYNGIARVIVAGR